MDKRHSRCDQEREVSLAARLTFAQCVPQTRINAPRYRQTSISLECPHRASRSGTDDAIDSAFIITEVRQGRLHIHFPRIISVGIVAFIIVRLRVIPAVRISISISISVAAVWISEAISVIEWIEEDPTVTAKMSVVPVMSMVKMAATVKGSTAIKAAAAAVKAGASAKTRPAIKATAWASLRMTSAPTMTTGVGQRTKRKRSRRDKPDQKFASSYHTYLNNRISCPVQSYPLVDRAVQVNSARTSILILHTPGLTPLPHGED